ncbi:MAG: fumarylacetoacetate hydrolase family protein [Deltaproteobacteria bacterium]|nr:MAG: fumarylacetoacetate hydrolase family protein [Deltaproteobacteria bacterium]
MDAWRFRHAVQPSGCATVARHPRCARGGFDALASAGDLAHCLEESPLPRVARVRTPAGEVRWARVLEAPAGVPSRVALLPGDRDLAQVLESASHPRRDAEELAIDPQEAAARICAPVSLPQSELDAERKIVVAAGLNYAGHAEEAGGGDVFLFPKPVEPTAPYGAVSAPAGITLLDYEVELGVVLLGDVALDAVPTWDALLEQSAFFIANDLTDREAIIRHATLTGPGTGFVEAKGQPGFLPLGPWIVRGRELFAAVAGCGGSGLPIRLEVDAGEGFELRQDANTELLLLDPIALLARVAEQVRAGGLRSEMPVERNGETRHYPLAVDEAAPRLPAGSIVLTGTPAGVALATPHRVGLLARGALHLRSPFEQFRQDELARAAAHEPGGYLAPGDRVRARIAGLGTQLIRIADPGSPSPEPCGSVSISPHR